VILSFLTKSISVKSTLDIVHSCFFKNFIRKLITYLVRILMNTGRCVHLKKLPAIIIVESVYNTNI